MQEARVDYWLTVIDPWFVEVWSDYSISGLRLPGPQRSARDPGQVGGRLRPLGRAAERHGYWEWVAQAFVGRLNRYVSLQVELDPSDDGDIFPSRSHCRLSVAAANSVHFRHVLVAQRQVADPEAAIEFMSQRLADAISLALRLTPADLDGTYVHSEAMRMRRWHR